MVGTKRWLLTAALACAAAMAFAGGGGEKAGGAAPTVSAGGRDPLGRYEPGIEVKAARVVGSNFKFAEGEDITNNLWTKLYKDRLGIQLNYVFTAPDGAKFDEKLNLGLASGDLPDVFSCSAVLYQRLVANGKLADLSALYPTYASDILKGVESIGDGIAVKAASVGGKLYGIPTPPNPIWDHEILWIRSDWLANLKLEPPKSIDDVIAIARAFAKNDPDGNGKNDTVGLGVDNSLFSGVGTLLGFFNGYHAYPRQFWLEKDGKLVFGAIQQEVKRPLQKLAELYQDGIIDNEFGVKGPWSELPQDVTAGKIGMVYGYHWYPVWPFTDNKTKFPQAEWAAYPIVSADGRPVLSQAESAVSSVFVVNASFKYPEAAIRMCNLSVEMFYGKSAELKYHNNNGLETHLYAFPRINDGYQDAACFRPIAAALKSGDTSKLSPEYKNYYDSVKAYNESPSIDKWAFWAIYKEDGSTGMMTRDYEEGRVILNKAYGVPTPTMVEKGSSLETKQIEYFTKAIIGGKVEQELADWVKYWGEQGGTAIAAEMNEWWKTQK